MAEKFSIKGLIKSLSMPLGIVAALALLLLLFTGTPFDRKTPPATPRIAEDEGKIPRQGAGAVSSTTGMRPPVSPGADLRKKDSSGPKNSRAKQLTRKNSLLSSQDSGAYQADDAEEHLLAVEDAGFLEEESLAGTEGALYTEAQLAELDAETIALVEEEIRQAREYQPEVEEEFDEEELENALAEEAAALEEERRLYPEGRLYTEAQLAELDPETRRLVEEEVGQAPETAN